MTLRQFIEQDITNQSATSDKNPKYKKARRKFRKNLLAMDYEKKILKEGAEEREDTITYLSKKIWLGLEKKERNFDFNSFKYLIALCKIQIKEINKISNHHSIHLTFDEEYIEEIFEDILKRLDEEEWIKQAKEALENSNDSFIRSFIKYLPKDIKQTKEEIDKLKSSAKKLPVKKLKL